MPTARGAKAEVPGAVRLAAGYARFSTERQSSIEDQERLNEPLARQHDVRLVQTFADPALSRSLEDRPGLTRLLAYLRENRDVRFIVVNELERITGDLRQRVRLAELCQQLDVTILTEDGPVDPFNDEHQQRADERAVGASAEVRKVRQRTRRSMKQKVLAGTMMLRPPFGTRMRPAVALDGSPLPPGTRLVTSDGKAHGRGVLEVEDSELPWLRRMFEWVADENCSLGAVARRLTEAGVPTKTGRAEWSRSSVRGILTNPFYRGEYVWGRQEVRHTAAGTKLVSRDEDSPERIVRPSPLGELVPAELWVRANEVITARAGSRIHSKRRVNPSRPFDGLVFCGRCGHKMYGRRDEKPRKDGTRPDAWRYYCIATRPGYGQLEGYGPPCRRSNAVSEKKIIDELAKLAADPTQPSLVVTFVPPAEVTEQVKALHKRLEDLELQYKRAVDLVIRGLLEPDELESRKVQHDRDVEQLKRRQQQLAQSPTPSTEYVFEPAEALQGVIPLLRERNLPAEVLRAGLVDMGLVRVLADSPGLKLEWAV